MTCPNVRFLKGETVTYTFKTRKMNVKSRCEIMKNEGVSITHIERLQNAYYVCIK